MPEVSQKISLSHRQIHKVFCVFVYGLSLEKEVETESIKYYSLFTYDIRENVTLVLTGLYSS